MRKSKAERARGSRSFQKARSQAREYVKDPDKLNGLIDQAAKKAHGKKGPLFAIWGQLSACFRLIRAYAKGTYREIPWSSLVMLVASVIYFVMPIDLIPDFIVGIGHLDDAALLGWTMKAVESDIEAFVEWETQEAA